MRRSLSLLSPYLALLLSCTPDFGRELATSPARFVGCYDLEWGEGIGVWDAGIPVELRLTTEPSEPSSDPSMHSYKSFAVYSPHQPTSPRSAYSANPTWRLSAHDSLEVDLSGPGVGSRYLVLIARASPLRLEGFIGRGDQPAGFVPLLDFTTTRTDCS